MTLRRPRSRGKRQAADLTGRRPEEWRCEPGAFSQLPTRPYQELWFELRNWGWRSLAVVPTSSNRSEFEVGEQLVVVGVSNTNRPMTLVSAEGVSILETDDAIGLIRAGEERGDRVITVVDCLADNPAAVPIVRAVNAVVLVVRLGESERASIERTIAVIGRERVVGVVTRED
jgi:hypothetical protein